MKEKYTARGSITVFLSMTLLIIISLVMTTVEALRAYSMSVYTQRALYTALDSVLAEYYYPLFKEYHVFGLDGGYTLDSIQEETIQDKISEYMQYTFEPDKDISYAGFNLPIKSFDILDINTKKVQIEDIHTLMDYDGELFRDQGIEYTKYSLAGEGAEKLLEKLNLINDSGIKDIATVQTIIKEKMIAEEGISIISDDLTNLYRLLDGIIITNYGPKTNKDGSLYINNTFIKKMCNSSSVINNPYPPNSWVSSSLKGKYVNPKAMVNKSISYLDSLIENNEIRVKAEGTDEAEKIIDECNKKEKILISDFKVSIKEIENLINSTETLINSAITVTNRLNSNQNKLTSIIEKYESILRGTKDIISDDLYSGLWKDYKELEKYKNSNSSKEEFYNPQEMKKTLVENQNIVKEVQKEITIKITSNKKTWLEGKDKLNQIRSSLSRYSHKNLQLDYSSLTKKEEGPDYFGGLNDLISNGFMDLLIEDVNEISNKNIKDVNVNSLPSNQYINLDNGSGDNTDNIGRLNSAGSFKVFINMVEDFTQSFTGEDFLLYSADGIGSAFLFQKYLLDHFTTYQKETKVEMPTSLEYEIEYILQGKSSDSDNLKSLVYNLIVFRTIMNTISLFSNAKSNEQAMVAATALVGFLGVPVLITTTKTIILFIWGLSESLIDISALLREKSIAIYKEFKDFQVQITELQFLNKALISQKVESMKNKTSHLYLDYEDHLNILLLIKNKKLKTFRALDLIQINLQNNYEDSFLISNCIFGIQVSADFSMESKFVSLPFIKESIGLTNQGYLHSTTIEYSY